MQSMLRTKASHNAMLALLHATPPAMLRFHASCRFRQLRSAIDTLMLLLIICRYMLSPLFRLLRYATSRYACRC